jgi:hypothetical protein
LCDVAARYGKLQLLQWLRASSCPWQEPLMLMTACRGGSVPVLEWLRTVTAPWTSALQTGLLKRAGWSNHLAAVQWLIAQGAEWPPTFAGCYMSNEDTTAYECWSLSAVQWAIASGSGWLDRHCADYAANNFINTTAKRHAAEVLEWAHANGCPCTCGHQQLRQ